MSEYSIRERCKITTNYGNDTFVGIKCDNGEFCISFPLGFHISDSEKELRNDILLLLNCLSSLEKKESTIAIESKNTNNSGFPIQAYLYLISDYISRGYYRETDVSYKVSKRGRINWGRTIKTQKAYVQDTDVFYLKYVTRYNPLNENELITLIHEYCVYESFCKIGWLFSRFIPQKPRIKKNKKLFKSTVLNKLLHTNNDRNKELFKNMLAVLDTLNDANSPLSFEYGVNDFNHAWEVMIDCVFGIKNKAQYFPKTYWNINNISNPNSDLLPDTIMLFGKDIFVLDAKNYKFGHTKTPSDLPQSSDINKQITYGEYIAENSKFQKMHGTEFKVYNAFLLPFDSSEWSVDKHFYWLGDATGNWKDNDKLYEHVQGILVDVHYLMKLAYKKNNDAIALLADCISDSITSRQLN